MKRLLATGHGRWRYCWSVPSVSSIWYVWSGQDTGFSGLRGPIPEGFGLRGMLGSSPGRPQLRFGREGFPRVQTLGNGSPSARPLRETVSPCDHLWSL